MMHDRQIASQVRRAVDACTRRVDEAPSLRHRILMQAKGDPPVNKKFSVALALTAALMLLTAGALAATLLQGGVLGWLFAGDAPDEVAALVDQHDSRTQSDAAILTLNETLFDGRKLTAGLTLQNPTGEPLVYAVTCATLNGQPLVAETALQPYGGAYGKALGGTVDGETLPTSAGVYATFVGVRPEGDPHAVGPLTASGEATLSLRVAVYRPTAPLTFLAPGEYVNGASALVCGGVALERDSHLLALQGDGLTLVEARTLTFPIRLDAPVLASVGAEPGAYANALFTLRVEDFTLSPTGGRLKARITVPDPAADGLPEDLTFCYAFPEDVFDQARTRDDWTPALPIRTQSGGVTGSPDGELLCDLETSFGAVTGELPRGVYLVWMTGNTGRLDWRTAIHVPLK